MSASRRVSRAPGAGSRWLLDHSRALSATLEAMKRRPFGTLLTALVIGVTLALPAGLHGVLSRLDTASSGLKGSLRASLFLKDTVDEAGGRRLHGELARRRGIADAEYLSRAAALAEFKAHSGFGEALDILSDNPLPAVIVVTPDADLPKAEAEALLDALTRLPEVDSARLDREWLERLYAILAVIERLVLLISAALGLTVLVVVANTTRLDIAARREEIVVLKLIGASNAFIRRPFLYSGLCHGAAGAGLGVLMVLAAGLALAGPGQAVAGLYGFDGGGSLLGADSVFAMILAGAGLGWLAALWTVGRHLGDIEPD